MQSILTGEAKHSRFFSQSFLSAKLEENLGQTETLTQRDKPAGSGEISGEGEKTASAATGIASIFYERSAQVVPKHSVPVEVYVHEYEVFFFSCMKKRRIWCVSPPSFLLSVQVGHTHTATHRKLGVSIRRDGAGQSVALPLMPGRKKTEVSLLNSFENQESKAK